MDVLVILIIVFGALAITMFFLYFISYKRQMDKYKDKARRGIRYINTIRMPEDQAYDWNSYIAFDI